MPSYANQLCQRDLKIGVHEIDIRQAGWLELKRPDEPFFRKGTPRGGRYPIGLA